MALEMACGHRQAAEETGGADEVVEIVAYLHGLSGEGIVRGKTPDVANVIVLGRFDNYTGPRRASCAEKSWRLK
jgi:hypothetical protein